MNAPVVLRDRAHQPLLSAALLALVAIGGAVDLTLDRPERWLSPHVVFELALMVTSLAFATILWLGWRRATSTLRATRAELEAREAVFAAEREAWMQLAKPALTSMSAAIDRQFAAWGLTPAEREVALLILKGLGHKQVAAQTGRSERTVRQHAVSVYQKSRLQGRAELAAFFLGGL